MLFQCWASVVNADPALKQDCVDVLCLLHQFISHSVHHAGFFIVGTTSEGVAVTPTRCLIQWDGCWGCVDQDESGLIRHRAELRSRLATPRLPDQVHQSLLVINVSTGPDPSESRSLCYLPSQSLNYTHKHHELSNDLNFSFSKSICAMTISSEWVCSTSISVSIEWRTI